MDLPIISPEVSLTELPRKEGDVLVVLFMSFASCSDLSELCAGIPQERLQLVFPI